jgi:predicted RNase H-like HicB family nuclease
MEYAVVIEESRKNLGAWVPDLPGCVSTGKTIDELLLKITEAIEFHIESLIEHGEEVPTPSVRVATVSVAS